MIKELIKSGILILREPGGNATKVTTGSGAVWLSLSVRRCVFWFAWPGQSRARGQSVTTGQA